MTTSSTMQAKIIIASVLILILSTTIYSTYAVSSGSSSKAVIFNNVIGGGGVDQNRVFKQLPSALLSGGWTADFDYKFTASSIPAFLIFDLTTTSDDPQVLPSANRILIEHGNGIDQLFITSSGGFDTSGIPISPNVQYYVRLDRTPNQLTLSVFSDPARTIQIPGSPVFFVISPTDFNNLNFIQHDGCTLCGPARTLTAEIDNMKISVIDSKGHQHMFFNDNYSTSKGWTQIGTLITVDGNGP